MLLDTRLFVQSGKEIVLPPTKGNFTIIPLRQITSVTMETHTPFPLMKYILFANGWIVEETLLRPVFATQQADLMDLLALVRYRILLNNSNIYYIKDL